jgi:hypothetical protein
MNTPLTRKEAASILLAFLANTGSIPYAGTSQGPGYPIESYSNDDVTIIWGEDDAEFELTEFCVFRNGEEGAHSFTANDVLNLQLDARCDAFE